MSQSPPPPGFESRGGYLVSDPRRPSDRAYDPLPPRHVVMPTPPPHRITAESNVAPGNFGFVMPPPPPPPPPSHFPEPNVSSSPTASYVTAHETALAGLMPLPQLPELPAVDPPVQPVQMPEAAPAASQISWAPLPSLGPGARPFAGPPPPADIALLPGINDPPTTALGPRAPLAPPDLGVVDPAFNLLARTKSSTVTVPSPTPIQSFKSLLGTFRGRKRIAIDGVIDPADEIVPDLCKVRIAFDREWYVSGGVVTGWMEIETKEEGVDSDEKSVEIWLGDIYVAIVGIEEIKTKDGRKRRTFLDRRCLLQDRRHPTDAVLRSRPPDKEGYWRARRGRAAFPFAIPLYTPDVGDDGYPRPLDLPSSVRTRIGHITYTVSGVVQYRDNTHRGTLTHHRQIAIYEYVEPVDAATMRARVVTAQARKKLGWLMLENVGVGPGGSLLAGSGAFSGGKASGGGKTSGNANGIASIGGSSAANDDDGDGELECAVAIERGLVAAGGVLYVRVLVRNETKRRVDGLRIALYRRAVRLDASERDRAEIQAHSRSLLADTTRVKLIAQRSYRGADYRWRSGVARECILALPIPLVGVGGNDNTGLAGWCTVRGKLQRVGFVVQVAVQMKLRKDLTVELPVHMLHPASWSDPPPAFESPLSALPVHASMPMAQVGGALGLRTSLLADKKSYGSDVGARPVSLPNIPHAVLGARPSAAVSQSETSRRADLISLPPHSAHDGEVKSSALEEARHRLENVMLQDRFIAGTSIPVAVPAYALPDGPTRRSSQLTTTTASEPASLASSLNAQPPQLHSNNDTAIGFYGGGKSYGSVTPESSLRVVGQIQGLRVVNPDMSGSSTISSSGGVGTTRELTNMLGDSVVPLPSLAEGDEDASRANDTIMANHVAGVIPTPFPVGNEQDDPNHRSVFTDFERAKAFFRIPSGLPQWITDATGPEQVIDVDAASITSFDTGTASLSGEGSTLTRDSRLGALEMERTDELMIGASSATGRLDPIPSDDEEDVSTEDTSAEDATGVIEFTYELQPTSQSTIKRAQDSSGVVQSALEAAKTAKETETTMMGSIRRRIIQVLGRKPSRTDRGIEGRMVLAELIRQESQRNRPESL